ncbi:hypothetical protein M378DRAFT_168037 [Amanita muscaria Koide BX008]|uniref:Uncharacterized protein n=1 Tax=Amanita muscaria (strain Koide BX008) TaxID=946122 RepID=A0A0C2WW36_AMAMK|nr:hypothetical protein M378DRAFT_168037 [Amanita muscaria Koide BX008]
MATKSLQTSLGYRNSYGNSQVMTSKGKEDNMQFPGVPLRHAFPSINHTLSPHQKKSKRQKFLVLSSYRILNGYRAATSSDEVLSREQRSCNRSVNQSKFPFQSTQREWTSIGLD